jgi:hypothetical protein
MSSVGLGLAGCTAIGSAMCEFGRKRLTKEGMDATTIISLVCVLQGLLGFSGLALTGTSPRVDSTFWPPALASAACSAVTATLLTKAYSAGDISLCAPFNAALPVFQFFVTTFIIRDEGEIPPHKIAGVCVVVVASFALAKAGKKSSSPDAGLLPPGASWVLLCCAIWSFVTKFDQEATRIAGGPIVYVCYAKLLTGLWAALGATVLSSSKSGAAAIKKDDGTPGSGRMTRSKSASAASSSQKRQGGSGAAMRSLRLLYAKPSLALVVLCVALIEGAYMGCYFAALARVSKVFVVAIKKGGNLLVSSVGGWVLFGESSEGRILPVVGVLGGVALMSL